jgi:uncharacterized protein (TIGR02246 family)
VSATDLITQTLYSYENALNTSSVTAAASLYAPDGVFMPPNMPSTIGTSAIHSAYEHIFDIITLNVKFTILEVVLLGNGWAFARTESKGTQVLKPINQKSVEANKELFLMQMIGDEWKIARYSFSTMNPVK